MSAPAYDFKQAARVPKGVTADGVMTEHDQIAEQYGKASIELSTLAVMSEPTAYPNLRAFGPQDAEEALKEGIARGIRYAYASVIPLRVVEEGKSAPSLPREVRVLFAVPDNDGDLVYERLTIIRKSPKQRIYVLNQLQSDVYTFTSKLQDVISELKALDES